MTRTLARLVILLGAVSCLLLLPTLSVNGQSGSGMVEWRSYGNDLRQTRYSPLDQINASNFNRLGGVAVQDRQPRSSARIQSPDDAADGKGRAVRDGGTRRSVIALNPGTGELLWKYASMKASAASRRRDSSPAAGALDEREGRADSLRHARLSVDCARREDRPPHSDLRQRRHRRPQNRRRPGDGSGHRRDRFTRRADRLGNTIMIGAAHLSGATPKSRRNQKGYIRGYDVVTGKRLWIFHTVPQEGEFGNETWLNNSWSYSGNAGVWAHMSIDEARPRHLPVEDATGDYYGGHRPGANLFTSGLVALDLKTAAWHYQFIHHDIWDWDIPCAPILADITVNGRKIRAIAQPTKQAWVYVLNRETGEPVWPIEERPAPKATWRANGSPTQRVPTKPAAFDRQGVTVDDLIDFTPELRAERSRSLLATRWGRSSRRRSSASSRARSARSCCRRRAAGRTGQAARTIPKRGFSISIPSPRSRRSGSSTIRSGRTWITSAVSRPIRKHLPNQPARRRRWR